MSLSQEIQAVYERALQIRQRAEVAPEEELLETALGELYQALDELRASDEEIRHQNQALHETRQTVERERQRYQTLFDLAPDGYLVTDHRGIIYQANRTAAQLLDKPQHFLRGKPLLVFVETTDRPTMQQHLQRPQPGRWEATLVRQHNPPVTVAIATTPIHSPQGQTAALLWSLRDVTQRRQVEEQLRQAHDLLEQKVQERTAALEEANQQLRHEIQERIQAEQQIQRQAALIDIVPDAIYVEDAEGRIRFWSPGAERIYGWSAAEVLGKTTADLWGAAAALPPQARLSQATGQLLWQGELRHHHRDGCPLTVLSRRTLTTVPQRPPEVLVVSTNITEKKALEDQFHRAQRLESLGTLIGGIAHDLNNTLAPMMTSAELLLQPALSQNSLAELAAIIKASAQHGSDLIRRLLTFAYGGNGRRVSLSVKQPLLEAIKTIEQTADKSIHICRDIPPNQPDWVRANSTQLYQVFLNLCINACHAMPQGGTLTLKLETCELGKEAPRLNVDAHPGSYVVITVADTGVGIDPSIIHRIFDPFFTTRGHSKGTGLGLSTVASIVKDYDGFIQVSSRLGEGSEFAVYLPAVDAVEGDGDLPSPAITPEGGGVLVVDDDLHVRQTTQFLLAAHGYDAHIAASGQEAIDFYRDHADEIDFVLLDVTMPQLDGMATLKQLQAVNPQVAVVVFSGLPDGQAEMLAAGAKAFLLKPYTPEALLGALEFIRGADFNANG